MIKKLFCFLTIVVLVTPIVAKSPATSAVDKKAGYDLLDAYTQFFHDMAVSGSGGYEKVSAAFRKFLADARQARQDNKIDQVFFSRFKRILTVTGLTMVPRGEEIFADVFNQELSHFVKDVLGEDVGGSSPEKSVSIGLLASAMSEELLNLRLYLDTIEAKEKLRKEFEGKFLNATPKKK